MVGFISVRHRGDYINVSIAMTERLNVVVVHQSLDCNTAMSGILSM